MHASSIYRLFSFVVSAGRRMVQCSKNGTREKGMLFEHIEKRSIFNPTIKPRFTYRHLYSSYAVSGTPLFGNCWKRRFFKLHLRSALSLSPPLPPDFSIQFPPLPRLVNYPWDHKQALETQFQRDPTQPAQITIGGSWNTCKRVVLENW